MDDILALRVSTTTDNPELAERLAASAVAAKLVGGAEVAGPVNSFFWHQGEAGSQPEWRVTFTTTVAGFPALQAHLRRAHDWDNPEITGTPIIAASEDYLEWLTGTVKQA